MKGVLVLCATSGQTETVFEVVDVTLNSGFDFISSIPFLRSAKCTGIGTKIFFRIKVNHSSAGRCGAGIITMADPCIFASVRIFLPFDFGTYKFVTCDAAFEFGGAFVFHGKCFIMRTAGNAIFV